MEWIAQFLGSPSTDGTAVFANVLSVIGRMVGSDALLVLIGGTIFLSFIRIPYSPTRKGRWLDERAHRWLWGMWAAALTGAVIVFFMRGPATRGVGFGDMFGEQVLLDTLDSRFGLAYFARVALLLAVVPLLLMGWPWSGGKGRLAARRRPGWLLAAALIMTAPAGGHSGAGGWPAFGVIVGYIHFASATIWGGGLLLMFASYLPRIDARLRQYLPQFSNVAVIAFVVAAFSGTVQAWRQLGSTGILDSFEALTSTTYGWLTIGKLAAFAVLVAIAAGSRHLSESVGNERPGVRASASEAQNTARIRHLIQVEFVVAFFVFLFTAMMTNVAPSYVDVRAAQAAAQQQEQAPAPGGEGQQEQQAQGQGQGQQGGAIQVAAGGNAWDPLEIQLPASAGVSIAVANTDGVLHSFTVDDIGVDQDIEGGQTATVQFQAPDPGTYRFYCKYHSGMEGTLTVG